MSRDTAWVECIRRIAAGEEAGLTRLYDLSSQLVYAVALRILADRADAEEVTLDVYTQVWRTAGTFERNRGGVASWLLMLCRSRAIDKVRSRASRRRAEEPPGESLQVVAPGASPEQIAVSRQEGARVKAALAELSPEQKQVIELAYFGGLSHSELAERLGQPVGTVKTRIRLGMIKLRAALGAAPERAPGIA